MRERGVIPAGVVVVQAQVGLLALAGVLAVGGGGAGGVAGLAPGGVAEFGSFVVGNGVDLNAGRAEVVRCQPEEAGFGRSGALAHGNTVVKVRVLRFLLPW